MLDGAMGVVVLALRAKIILGRIKKRRMKRQQRLERRQQQQFSNQLLPQRLERGQLQQQQFYNPHLPASVPPQSHEQISCVYGIPVYSTPFPDPNSSHHPHSAPNLYHPPPPLPAAAALSSSFGHMRNYNSPPSRNSGSSLIPSGLRRMTCLSLTD